MKIDHLKGFILPGVGAFPEGMKRLKERGLDVLIRKLIQRKIPGMGICLGMQMLSDSSTEGGKTIEGLGFYEGNLEKLDSTIDRVPHIGWTSTESTIQNQSWQSKLNGDFYYLHSYSMSPLSAKSYCAATFTHSNKKYLAAIYKDRFLGVQFHPEKSQEAGLELIKSFFNFYSGEV